jgi:YVTN family beta-propeller protein
MQTAKNLRSRLRVFRCAPHESDNTLRVVDTSTNKVIATIKLTGRPNQCAVTPDGHYVAVPPCLHDAV